MGNREDKLKEILKRVPMSEPSHRFTDVVIQEMEEIEAAVAGKVHADEKLKILLQHHPAPAPSNAFTYKVLNTIREKSQVERKPVISKGAWGLIVSFVVICIATAAFTGNGD